MSMGSKGHRQDGYVVDDMEGPEQEETQRKRDRLLIT